MYCFIFDSEWEIYFYVEVLFFGNGGLVCLDLFLFGDYIFVNVFMDVSIE